MSRLSHKVRDSLLVGTLMSLSTAGIGGLAIDVPRDIYHQLKTTNTLKEALDNHTSGRNPPEYRFLGTFAGAIIGLVATPFIYRKLNE